METITTTTTTAQQQPDQDQPHSFTNLTKRTFSTAVSSLDEAFKLPSGTASKKRKTEPKPAPISTPALLSLLSPTLRPIAPPIPPPSYTPTSLSSLLSRIATYKLSSYSHKPPSLSPSSCALQGWENKGPPRERIQCVTCENGIVLEPPTGGDWNSDVGKKLEGVYKERLKEGHKSNCPWRMSWCKVGLYRVHAEGKGKMISTLMEESRAVEAMGQAVDLVLPRELEEEQLDLLVATLSKSLPASTSLPSRPSILLPLFGWNPSSSPILKCSLCTRQVLLSPTKPFDLVKQHQPFCPYVIPDPTTGTVGWRVRLEGIVKRTRVETENGEGRKSSTKDVLSYVRSVLGPKKRRSSSSSIRSIV